MYPSEASLIPVTIALTKFVEEYLGSSWFSILSLGKAWFPYWYLGTPYRYLTGPLVPIVLSLLHEISPDSTLFNLTFILIGFTYLLSIVGWLFLVKRIQNSNFKTTHLILLVLLLVFPWRMFTSLSLSEASLSIARNLLPFVLLAIYKLLVKRELKEWVTAVFAVSLLLLTNTGIFTILLVGIIALIFARSFKNNKFSNISYYIKRVSIAIILSLLIVTLWYTPGYWWLQLINPSIGGVSGIKVFVRILELLKGLVPLGLAVFAVYFSMKLKKRLSVFTLVWVFAFLFLTTFRFIGDPDFWTDWSVWLYELEIGVAILVSLVINGFVSRKVGLESFPKTYYLIPIALLFPFYLTWRVHLALGKPELLPGQVPEEVSSLNKAQEIVGNESRIFLSGSTVFWAGSYDTPPMQVRGGADRASIHPLWQHAAYQLREGKDPELAKRWLSALGTQYVLVHTDRSRERYHDFKNNSKWKEVGKKVWEEEGDILYQIGDVSMAWVVDLDALSKAEEPENGKDKEAIGMYIDAKKRPVSLLWDDSDSIGIKFDNLGEGEGVVVAITYHRGWKTDVDATVEKDVMGNVLIIPEDNQLREINLKY